MTRISAAAALGSSYGAAATIGALVSCYSCCDRFCEPLPGTVAVDERGGGGGKGGLER